MLWARRFLIPIGFFALVSLAACATSEHKSIEPTKYTAIHSVSVKTPVEVPENPSVVGPDIQQLGIWAQLAASGGSNEESQTFKEHLQRNNISIGSIVRQQCIDQLKQRHVFPALVPEGGDATLEIAVEQYGFDAVNSPISMFREEPLKPKLTVAAKLVSSSGEILWQNTAFLNSLDDRGEAHKIGELLSDPALTREVLDKTARIVVAELLNDFEGFSAPPVGAATAAAAQAAIPQPGASPASPPEGLLPAAGRTWTYAVTDRAFGKKQPVITVRVVSSSSTIIEEYISASSSTIRPVRRIVEVGAPSFVQVPLQGSDILLEFAPYLFLVPESAHASLGEAGGYPAVTGDPAWVTRISAPIAQRVSVPAGSFSALRVEIAGKRYAFSAQMPRRFLVRVWYVPEVKRYVKLELEEWAWSGKSAHVMVELMRVSPPS
jgi:hypothetical protein